MYLFLKTPERVESAFDRKFLRDRTADGQGWLDLCSLSITIYVFLSLVRPAKAIQMQCIKIVTANTSTNASTQPKLRNAIWG
jgi:hypothetical protein